MVIQTCIVDPFDCYRSSLHFAFWEFNYIYVLVQVLMEGKCLVCGENLKCTIRDVLYQPDYAGTDYEDVSKIIETYMGTLRTQCFILAFCTKLVLLVCLS